MCKGTKGEKRLREKGVESQNFNRIHRSCLGNKESRDRQGETFRDKLIGIVESLSIIFEKLNSLNSFKKEL